jgi:hypothetical protein
MVTFKELTTDVSGNPWVKVEVNGVEINRPLPKGLSQQAFEDYMVEYKRGLEVEFPPAVSVELESPYEADEVIADEPKRVEKEPVAEPVEEVVK